jgi:hypothetical protein
MELRGSDHRFPSGMEASADVVFSVLIAMRRDSSCSKIAATRKLTSESS